MNTQKLVQQMPLVRLLLCAGLLAIDVEPGLQPLQRGMELHRSDAHGAQGPGCGDERPLQRRQGLRPWRPRS